MNSEGLYSWEFLQSSQTNIFTDSRVILVILSFTFANWFFEVFKWKTLVNSVKSISFFEAFKQSTSSLTASLLTPNRIGEYGAKAIYFNRYQRKKVMFLNLIGNLSQMLITVIFGLLGFAFLYNILNFTVDLQNLYSSLFVGLFFLSVLLLYRFRHAIQTRFITKIVVYFKDIPADDLKNSIWYSLIRYLIFSHQFYFLLMFFRVELDYLTAMGAIFSMYFIASVMPSFVVFDFIVKGSIAISVFGLFDISEMVVLGVTTIMWLLNFAFPAIIGSYYVFAFELPKPAKIIVK